MRHEASFRLWTVVVCVLSFVSGSVFWHVGERLAGGCGIATALLHLVWAIDPRALLRGRWQRRPIVIPRLRSDTRTVRHG